MRDPRLVDRAKRMRREPTEPELRLWNVLRAKRFNGIKFRYQKVIGHYIADFSSRAPMLVIEIDGNTHVSQQDYDARRTAFLESQGYCVIRFTNSDVMTNLEGVVRHLQSVIDTPPLPSPLRGSSLSPEGERAL
jgi:very-short-patch-repair endonuclease